MKITYNALLLPEQIIDVGHLLYSAGKNKDEIQKTLSTTGINTIRVVKSKQFSDFIFTGLEQIKISVSGLFDEVDAIIVVSQSYDCRIPSISTRIQKILNLRSDIFCLDIMDGCSGYIKALAVARMLQSNGNKNILIIAGDLNSSMTKKADLGTKILFGDGLSVSIVEPLEYDTVTLIENSGDLDNVISCQVHQNVMNMNGFEVFRFTKNRVPELLNEFFNQTKTTPADYDLIALHQASKLVVSTITRALGVSNNLCNDFLCSDIGNLGAGSIGAWLSQVPNLSSRGALNMLVVGYGSGLSWGVTSIIVDTKMNEVINVQG